jgi:hypothetical protein
MKGLINIWLLIVVAAFPQWLNAQAIKDTNTRLLGTVIIDKDTVTSVQIAPINVYPKKVFKNNRQKRQYTRLMYNVKKAYPFAKIARSELSIMNSELEKIQGDKEREKYIKEYQKQMFIRYEDDLKQLTMSQGRILLKLVDREIGNTSYNLVKEYRGSFSAAFWQGIARLFGSNMKVEYDAKGDDAQIEEIIQLIDTGVI